VALLSWRTAQAIGRSLGLLLYRLNARERRRMADHLELAFPEMSPRERDLVARHSAAHHGTSLTENLQVLARGAERARRHMEVQGWEHVEVARAGGRPLLLVTGHCGNWELLGAALMASGLPVFGFGRALQHSAFQEALERLRARFGARTIVRGEPGSARSLRQILGGQAALVMLIDQDTAVDGVWIPFFGRPAYTPTAAAELGLRHQMAVLPVFLSRRADGTHLCRFLPAVDLPSDVTAVTAALSALIERQIRQHPEQWVWMHRRWRRQPPAEAPVP
jgi:KDO2-lipid IV(A) lauroyltransferase